MVAGPKMRMPFDVSYGSVIREVAIGNGVCVCLWVGWSCVFSSFVLDLTSPEALFGNGGMTK